MDRIKRISNQLLERYPNRFGIDFDQNKKAISEIAIIRSKMLRNKIAGYITSHLHRQTAEKELGISSEGEEGKEGTEEE